MLPGGKICMGIGFIVLNFSHMKTNVTQPKTIELREI